MTIRRQAKDMQNSTNMLFWNRARTNKHIISVYAVEYCCLIGLPELFKIDLPEVQEAQLLLCGSAIVF